MTDEYSKTRRVGPVQCSVTRVEKAEIDAAAKAAGKTLVDYFMEPHRVFGKYGYCPACDRTMVPLKDHKLCYMCSEDSE